MQFSKNAFHFLLAGILLLGFAANSYAVKYTSGCTVTQIQGPSDNGDTGQLLLKITLQVTNGGGTPPKVNDMTFNLLGFSEMSNVELWTSDQVDDFSGAILLGSQTPGASVTIINGTANDDASNGSHYYWLTCDMNGSISPDVILDAEYVSGSYTTGPPTFTGSLNPAGFRLSDRSYTIGTGENYATVKDAADAIVQFVYDGAVDVFMELTANYLTTTEVLSPNFTGHTGPAVITFRPASGETGKISQVAAAATFFAFDNVQNITLDGRPGGVGSTIEWSIRNTKNTSVIGPVIEFINDATGVTLKYLEIKGDIAEDDSKGVITIGGTTNTTGNDNITLSNCHIKDLSVAEGGLAAFPRNGIYSLGTAGKSNDNITIDNCHFVDIYEGSSSSWISSACRAFTNNNAWTITNNHFYQTTGFTGLESGYRFILTEDGGNHTVSGNFLGGTAPSCGGAQFTITKTTENVNGKVRAISLTTTSDGNTIAGNTIANMSYTTKYNDATYPFIVIAASGSGNFEIGTSGNGNTIGSISGSGSVVLTNDATSTSSGLCGIYNESTGTVNVSDNNFGAITVNGTRDQATTILIENASGAGAMTVSNNTLGNTTTDNILVSSDSRFEGISNASTNGITATNNTIQNSSQTFVGTSAIFNGITNSSGILMASNNTIKGVKSYNNLNSNVMINHSGGNSTISGNAFQDISVLTSSSGSLTCVNVNSAGTSTISGNTLGGTSDNNMTIAVTGLNYGIMVNGGGTYTITNNNIQEFNLTDVGTNSSFLSIAVFAGNATVSGNTIQNIDLATTKTSGTYTSGIHFLSAGTSQIIRGNVVKNINLTTTSANGVKSRGIFLSVGDGLVENNFITGMTNTCTDPTAIMDGILETSGNWNLYNNVIILDNGANTNELSVNGINTSSTGTGNIYHNTVKIAGTTTGGATNTHALLRTSASGTTVVKNNIFQNLRTGGTGKHYTENSVNTGTFTTDYNYVENITAANLCNYGGTDYNLAGWQGAPVNAKKSITGTITFDALGVVTTDPFVGAGSGTDLTATVTDDKNVVARGIASWLGAYEGQNITTSAISPLVYCAGDPVSVPYTIGGSGTFVGPNIFTAQLSGASGGFSSPTSIGTLASTNSGTISATLPGGISGTSYRIRVVSDDPVIYGANNGSAINIQFSAPSATTANAATAINCSGFTANWAIDVTATNFFIDVATDAGFTAILPAYNNLDIGNVTSYAVTGLIAGTNYYYRLRSSNGCGLSPNSNTIGPVLTTGTQGTYTVINTLNTGAGSLRQAILDANGNCGHDIINFNLGAGGPFTIALTATLPDLTDNDGVTIDGWDNSGNDGTPNTVPVFNATAGTPLDPVYKIILGNSGNVPTGLILASDNNIIQGLVLQDFGDGTPSINDIAVTISGDNNQILGCFIGLEESGAIKGTKTYMGISITGSSNKIGDGTAAGANLISGMNAVGDGIRIAGATAGGNTVRGNIIGLQKDGATIVAGANQYNGVYITSTGTTSNTIGGSVVGEGNVISGNNNQGILISNAGSAGTIITGNYIGTCADGASFVASSGQDYGIELVGSPNCIIGGNTASERNVISGNEWYGIYLTGTTTGNIIKGNYIGIDKTGTTFIAGSAQDRGIWTQTSAVNNIIGGTGAGEGNVISGNSSIGVYLNSTAAGGNSIIGNIIGPQADGTTYLASNTQLNGVEIINSPNNTVGGSTAAERNIISANEDYGVYITGATSTGNIVKGNYIGIDQTGTTFITGSSQNYGVYIFTTAGGTNTIGGSGSGEGNVISGNSDGGTSGRGIYMASSATAGNAVLGNIIGPQVDGVTYLTSNAQYRGIVITNSPNNTIGGNSAGARNTISANETDGIQITGASSTGNVIKGNYIGIDASGTTFITGSTQNNGVRFILTSGGTNTIGGSGAGEGNVISGNSDGGTLGIGIRFGSTAAAGNSALGNIIGPQADGVTYLTSSGQSDGIRIDNSPNNTIGGSTAGARNIISANETYGVYFTGASATGNVVKGNYIGIDKNGTSFITNSTQNNGVYLSSSSSSNTIGGSGSGEGNVISGNKSSGSAGYGIYINNAGGNTVLGNIIGPQFDGNSLISPSTQSEGIVILSSSNTIIGGNTAGARNFISGNESKGIWLSGATNTNVHGNFIGIAKNGSTIITGSSQDYGVYFDFLANSNSIGGSNSGEGNVISGNTNSGIGTFSLSASGNTIKGNKIGTQSDGLSYVASNTQLTGITINGSPNNIVGGNVPGERNIISANESKGILLNGAGATGNVMKGNYIGPSSSLTNIASSNQDYGVYIQFSTTNNSIGTGLANEENQIAFNTVNGIYMTSLGATGNLVSANPIYSNTGKPIELNYGASQANNGQAVPVISLANATTVSGTSGISENIEVFKNANGICTDVATFLGSVTADGAGNWSLGGLSLVNGEFVLATATDGTNNTSEFSTCSPVVIISDLFWIANAGDWNDGSHWSTTSGGGTCSCTPTTVDDVIFDANSFSGSGQVVTIPAGTWNAKSLDFQDPATQPAFKGSGSLIITQ